MALVSGVGAAGLLAYRYEEIFFCLVEKRVALECTRTGRRRRRGARGGCRRRVRFCRCPGLSILPRED